MTRKLDALIFGDVDTMPLHEAAGDDWLEAIDKVETSPRLAVSLLLNEIRRHSREFDNGGYIGEFLPRFKLATAHAYSSRVRRFERELLDAISENLPVAPDGYFDRSGVSLDIEFLLNIYAKVSVDLPSHAQPHLVGNGPAGDNRGMFSRLASRIADLVGPAGVPIHPARIVRAAAEAVVTYSDEIDADNIPMSSARGERIERTALEIDRRFRQSVPSPDKAQLADLEVLRVFARKFAARANWQADAAPRHITSQSPDAVDTTPEADYRKPIEAVFNEISVWLGSARHNLAEPLASISRTVDEIDVDDFGVYIQEAMSEFKAWLLNRAMPEYDGRWIAAYPEVDRWVCDHIERKGLSEQILAIFAYRGVQRTFENVENLAAAHREAENRPMSAGM